MVKTLASIFMRYRKHYAKKKIEMDQKWTIFCDFISYVFAIYEHTHIYIYICFMVEVIVTSCIWLLSHMLPFRQCK